MRHRSLLVLCALLALASSAATRADTPSASPPPTTGQTPAQCTTDGVLPGSSAYLRCTYSPVRLLTEAKPRRRPTLADRRKTESDAQQRQAAGAAGVVDMVRTIGVAQGGR
jgi:hypothetical protein